VKVITLSLILLVSIACEQEEEFQEEKSPVCCYHTNRIEEFNIYDDQFDSTADKCYDDGGSSIQRGSCNRDSFCKKGYCRVSEDHLIIYKLGTALYPDIDAMKVDCSTQKDSATWIDTE
jgi:hypothetical protein